MDEAGILFLTAFFSAFMGFVFAGIFYAGNKKQNGKEKIKEEIFDEREDTMLLRNGYGVTRDKNPTLAEQWVNIMNYCGESQTEDGYEEEND